MGRNVKWTENKCIEEALKYSSRGSFRNNSRSAYNSATRQGILDDICSHMIFVRNKWTDSAILEAAAKFTSAKDFQAKGKGAASAAFSRGLWNEATKHMSKLSRGFDKTKPAILYYFKINNVWKIGVTNNNISTRYCTKDVANIKELQIWKFSIGTEALAMEQLIKKVYSPVKAKGKTPFIGNTGITECFSLNILQGGAL